MSVAAAGPRRPASAKSQRTRETLVRSAHHCVSKTGELSPDQVARHAGVSTATFYSHFASKDEAIAAALGVALAETSERGIAPLNIEQLLDDGLEATVRAAISETVAGFREHHRVLRLGLSRLPHDRSIRQVYRERERESLARLRRFLELAQAAERVRAGDPDAMAGALLISLLGLNNPVIRSNDDPAIMDELVVQLTGWLSAEAP
jgi:AcrR family transcriptional regulator